jgi:hypothetical protein
MRFLFYSYYLTGRRDSSVGIVTKLRPGLPYPIGIENVSLRHHVQIGSGAHPASYPMGTGGSFSGG